MPIQATEKIWHNGNLIAWDQARIHVMSHVIHYGSSVFEGVRCYGQPQGSAVFRLPEHMQRLLDSAKIYRMEVPFTLEELCAGVVETIEANGVAPCYIRPIVLRGYGEIGVNPKGSPVDVYIANFPWGKYLAGHGGADVCISSWNRLAPNTMPALAKAGANYMNSQLIKMEAEANGYQEGIALDVNGLVSEGSGENIFIVRNGVLFTPPLGSSALSGITRDSVLTIGIHGDGAGDSAGAPVHLGRSILYGNSRGGAADPVDRPHRDWRRQARGDYEENRGRVLRHCQRVEARPVWLADAGESGRE
jgi:branched-chain amino acid aminotransferase